MVAAIDSNGEADFHFVRVVGLDEHIHEGLFGDAAKEHAESEGFEPYLAYDELDRAGHRMLGMFEWKTSSIIYLDSKGKLVKDGDSVVVPDPNDSDIHQHSFDGIVTEFRNGNAIVVDMDDNSFEIEPHRLNPDSE